MPAGGLLVLKNYCAITFPNTHCALQAEKVLQAIPTVPFMIMPVPNMISAGCGLAVKTTLEVHPEVLQVLNDAAVLFDGVYSVDREKGLVYRIV